MTEAGRVAVLGSINVDVVLRVAAFPRPGETLIASGVARHGGGKGANQAIAAARAGAAVSLIGAVGDDADGRAMLAALRDDGVDCDAVRIVGDAATGAAYILVANDGENQIVVAPGANGLAAPPVAVEARVLLAQLETPLDAVAAFLAAKPPGSTSMLNAAPFIPAARPLLDRADIVVVNEIELAGYCGPAAAPDTPRQAAGMAAELLSSDRQRIVVTLGAAGSVTVGRGGPRFASSPQATVVDTTGAGDCFCGYLAAGLAAGCDLDAAIANAHRAAAMAVGRAGATPSIPCRAEIPRPAPAAAATPPRPMRS